MAEFAFSLVPAEVAIVTRKHRNGRPAPLASHWSARYSWSFFRPPRSLSLCFFSSGVCVPTPHFTLPTGPTHPPKTTQGRSDTSSCLVLTQSSRPEATAWSFRRSTPPYFPAVEALSECFRTLCAPTRPGPFPSPRPTETLMYPGDFPRLNARILPSDLLCRQETASRRICRASSSRW